MTDAELRRSFNKVKNDKPEVFSRIEQLSKEFGTIEEFRVANTLLYEE